MKKIFTLVFAIALAFTASAQLPEGSIAPDFTVTDIDGTSHNLYDILDEGKVVIVDIFATWCPPCWNYHQSHALVDAFSAYGPDGTNELFVFGMEGDGSTNLECMYGPTGCNDSTFGDWTEGVNYPLVNDNSIASLYNLPYWPIIYIIYPTREVYEMGQAQVGEIEEWLGNKPSLSAGINPDVINFTGHNGGYCSDLLPDAPYYLISNMGEENITSVDIKISKNSEVLYEEAWTGDASSYQVISEVQLPSQIVTSNTVFTLEMNNINGDASESRSSSTYVTLSANNVINVTGFSDNAADLNYYEIKDEQGNNVFVQPLETTTQTYTHFLPGLGCYQMWVYDSAGNGINAELVATDGEGNVVYANDGFGSLDIQEFNVAALSSTSELLTGVQVELSPNPASDELNLQLDLEQNASLNLNIFNISGQLERSVNMGQLSAGSSVKTLDISNLSSGLYFLSIENNSGILTKRFVIK